LVRFTYALPAIRPRFTYDPPRRPRLHCLPPTPSLARFFSLAGSSPDTRISHLHTTLELGPLKLWAIESNRPTPLDHALIVLEWANIDSTPRLPNRGEITG